jgi:hypothetical protein
MSSRADLAATLTPLAAAALAYEAGTLASLAPSREHEHVHDHVPEYDLERGSLVRSRDEAAGRTHAPSGRMTMLRRPPR